MDASKVSVSPEHLRFAKMGRNKKAELRRKNIITLIRSKPAGTPITLAEFQQVCALTTTAAAYGLVKTMLNRGTIVRQVEGLNRHSYVVAADAVNMSKPEQKPAVAIEDKPRGHDTVPNKKTLTEYARDFAWEHNSDSLREFVGYMDGKELELRRSADKV